MSILDSDDVKRERIYYEVEHPRESEIRQWMRAKLPYLTECDYEIVFWKFEKRYGDILVKYDGPATIMVHNKDVILTGYPDKTLPDYICFGEIIGGSFICSHSKLTSMHGFPKVVGRVFDCSYSYGLKSLDEAPILVDVDFSIVGNNFKEQDIRQHCQVTYNVHC